MLVVGEDADLDTMPQRSRIHDRIILQLREVMNVDGVQIYDKTALEMSFTDPHRIRMNDAQIIERARAVQIPLDVVMMFEVFASVKSEQYNPDIRRPHIRIPARILNVHTGQQIASDEAVNRTLPPLPTNCDRECILELVGDEARLLATDLADYMRTKLANFGPGGLSQVTPGAAVGQGLASTGAAGALPSIAPSDASCSNLATAYSIELKQFSPEEMTEMETGMAGFGCYQSMRPIRVGGTFANYWYESTADSGRVNRNLRLLMEYLGIEGRVTFTGNTFEVTKTVTR